MTVKEWIVKWTLKQTKERHNKLKEMGAPKVMVDGIEKQINSLEKGTIKIGGDSDALMDEFHDVERKTGKGGQTYFVFNGNVYFFPQAQYGMFIKRAREVVENVS